MPLRRLQMSAQFNYLLILATFVSLVITTGGVNSAFLSLLIMALPFSWAFGRLTGTLALVSAIGLIGYEYAVTRLTTPQLIALGVILLASIIVGLLSLLRKPGTSSEATTEDRSYNELASELSQVASKSEVVINAIGDGVLALDGQGVIQLINPAAQNLLGWTKHDALSLSYKSIFKMFNNKNEEVDTANDPVAHTLSTNKTSHTDNFSVGTHSGKSFLASISVTPVKQLGSGVIIVFRDITAEKSDERQRAEFISTASHEMRTPVASIEGYLGLALNPQTATIDEKARDFITKAHDSAQHLGRLFADLLDVSKADDSRLKNDPKVVDVISFIHDIVEGLTPKANEKGLRTHYKPMPNGDNDSSLAKRLNPVYYANVDNDHLREIVQNLVENAIKYTPQGDVTVDVNGQADKIVISVTDTGIGIPREDQAHLFQKFYRVDNSDTREIGGTGLGLYLCRRLAETIGGRIWVESEYKKGSTFFVEIPRTDNDDAQRMIEQASFEAERQAEQEQQAALQGQPVAPVAPIETVVDTTNAAVEPTPVAPEQPLAPTDAAATTYAAAPAQPVPQPVQPVPITYASPTPQVVVQPQMPQPVAVQPEAPIAPQAPSYTPAPQPTPQATLADIEAAPHAYLQPRDTSINVPPRPQ